MLRLKRILCIVLVAVALVKVSESQYSAESSYQEYQQRSPWDSNNNEGASSGSYEDRQEDIPLTSVERMMFPGLFGNTGQQGAAGQGGQQQNGLGALTNLFNSFGSMFGARRPQGGSGMSGETGGQQRNPFNFNFTMPNFGRMFGQIFNISNNNLARSQQPPKVGNPPAVPAPPSS